MLLLLKNTDEYITSFLCPECGHDLETFHYVDDPRSWCSAAGSKKLQCYGLFRCKSARCMDYAQDLAPQPYRIQHLNRDIAAVLNFHGPTTDALSLAGCNSKSPSTQ
ncbi:hypothetical protein BX070DRAFT_263002 [Coemansia spiralis]|nr:hypothetical protein BX070DRAFT_263002 [Coemansia spiralis]